MRAWLTAAVCGVAVLVAAPSALGATSRSTNWAGYAVHRTGVSFHEVTGVWTEPKLNCHRGRRTFSSYWVGLGGYSRGSRALEQTGTEADCTSTGHVRTFAWYEVVPAPSVRVALKVPPGDQIQGEVVATGHRIRLTLHDLTKHTTSSKMLNARPVDVSSAEWIVEAPSDCLSPTDCITLPLGNFGMAGFTGASVESASGHVGSISDPGWGATRIRLVPTTRSYVLNGGMFGRGGAATPSVLVPGGTGFTVSYHHLAAAAAGRSVGRLADTGRLFHLGR